MVRAHRPHRAPVQGTVLAYDNTLIQSVIMIRTQISLEPEMYEEAKREAARRGISFAELVRRVLAKALPGRSSTRPWMRLAGIVEEAGPDASRTVDAVVYGRERP